MVRRTLSSLYIVTALASALLGCGDNAAFVVADTAKVKPLKAAAVLAPLGDDDGGGATPDDPIILEPSTSPGGIRETIVL